MGRFWCFLLLYFSALFPAAASSVIQVAPQSPTFAGVSMFMEGGAYTLNFTAARDACLTMGVTMATKDQILQALKEGLETCKFGWISEQVVVIPRRASNPNCGKGQTGVVVWRASLTTKFGVFCFNASDFLETLNTSEAPLRSSTSPTTLTARAQTSTAFAAAPVTPNATEAATSAKPSTTKPPQRTTSSSTTPLFVETTRLTPASLKTVSTRAPPSPQLITSSPAVLTAASSTSVSVPPPPTVPQKPSFGALPTTLIVFGVIVMILTAAGAVWHHKLNRLTFWSLGQQKDDTETEMWKHADSELDLDGHHGDEEDDELEGADRKYSSDITLCVNPDIKKNCSE
ncbi:lymphatic vessel endothelial hyaluronic receptor 1b [Echeneis naucrates]|uniref:lymphatic vessel endothelial hyaluronic receptor 1b n=1 Tax=Echeneis naucrates TaxID=173247 RepID=UPI0011139F30|nr:lymphatic vessel endothelial hyaluronic acid receptor 1-like [Echeneis naucrates]